VAIPWPSLFQDRDRVTELSHFKVSPPIDHDREEKHRIERSRLLRQFLGCRSVSAKHEWERGIE
jgi:hypothetical protein